MRLVVSRLREWLYQNWVQFLINVVIMNGISSTKYDTVFSNAQRVKIMYKMQLLNHHAPAQSSAEHELLILLEGSLRCIGYWSIITHTHTCIYIHTHIHIYIYIHIYHLQFLFHL